MDLSEFMRMVGAPALRPRTFSATFRCYSMAVLGRPELEEGDKIVLPPSALRELTTLEVQYPMMFRVAVGLGGVLGSGSGSGSGSAAASRATHCGVIEFIAEEGRAYLPHWMMQNLLLEEGHFVEVGSAVLPKGTFVKFRPHSTDFIRLSNPKAVLERHLPKFSCLTQGDTIVVSYQGRQYHIDVLQVKPAVSFGGDDKGGVCYYQSLLQPCFCRRTYLTHPIPTPS